MNAFIARIKDRAPHIAARYGALVAIVFALPAFAYLGAEVRGSRRPLLQVERPGDAAVRSTLAVGEGGTRGGDDGRHLPTPEVVKGIYITASTAASPKRMAELADLVDRTELNAMVIDIKNHKGAIAFVPKSPELAPHVEEHPSIKDLEAFTAGLHERGIYLIARNFVFQDPAFVEKRPELAVQRAGGGVWRDRKGVTWLDAASKEIWKYNVAVSEEAFNAGFDEIQFDYIRFPSDGNLKTIRYPVYDGKKPKTEVMREFFTYLDKELRVRRGIPISVDLFGLTMWQHDSDLNIGQRIRDAAPHFDFISPMVYPSHYPTGFNGLANPAAHPYDVVYDNMVRGQKLFDELKKDNEGSASPIATVRPWLQDFDLGARYTPEMVRAQITASMKGGASGWLLWNARNVYTASALEKGP